MVSRTTQRETDYSARTDFDRIEEQVDRDALRDDFDVWYQRIDAAEDKKLNINHVLDENDPTEALIEALDTEADFQNFTVQHNIEINFEGWGDEDKKVSCPNHSIILAQDIQRFSC